MSTVVYASCLGGYTAQALGLQYTTAANGAFTGTFTVLVVPLLVGLSGRAVPLSTWLAAMVALFGRGLPFLGTPLLSAGPDQCSNFLSQIDGSDWTIGYFWGQLIVKSQLA